MVIGIIGGGASGMAAAWAAAQNPNNQVLLFERQARLGRKLLATGNGRCNLTNLHAGEGGFHGEDPAFARSVLAAYPPEKILGWFEGLGLLTVAEDSGRVYPYSDQANSVVDCLRFALEKENIRQVLGCEILKARKVGDQFSLETKEEKFLCHKLIIACGGLAGTKLGGTLAGYKLLGKLGHKCTELRPALVQLKSDFQGCVGLKGVRCNCRIEILHNSKPFARSSGELQFTEYGLSGPVIFEISRDVCREKGLWEARVDFLPQLDEGKLLALLTARHQTALPCSELFTGILHNRLGRVLCKTAGIPGDRPVAELDEVTLLSLCQMVKGFYIHLKEPMGMDSAQVTAGGVLTHQFDPVTLESRLTPGLYACGEVLDIDGDCGGYNLQWAWASGLTAGEQAGKEIHD